MKLHDRLTGALIVLLGLAVAGYAQSFPPMPGQRVGPGLLPTIIGVLLAALGAVIFVSGLGQRRVAPPVEIEEWARRPRVAANLAILVADLVFYVAAAETLGFFITGFVFLVVLLSAFGASRRWIVPMSVAVTAAIHFGFYTLLHVPLPWGVLERIAW